MTSSLSRSLIKTFLGSYLLVLSFLMFGSAQAEVLLPGNISTCGEIVTSGTYTLTQNLTASATSSCFLIQADNVIVDGAGYTVSGTGELAIDARSYDIDGITLLAGSNGYTNLLINNITFTGFTNTVDASGNDDLTGTGVNYGYAGNGGDVALFYTTSVGNVTANGGRATNVGYGGLGGNITFTTDGNLNLSNRFISAAGGFGSIGKNTSGGLDLNYGTSSTLTHTNLTLSSFSFFNDNSTTYGTFPGGSWPMTPGNISTCGTLLGPGTFTLTQDLTASSTCFYIFSNNVTLNGNGHTLTASASTTDYAIVAGDYASTTIASTTFVGFPNLISSTRSVTLTNSTLDLSNQTIAAATIYLTAANLNIASTTFSSANTLTIKYSSSIVGTSTAYSSALTSLVINNLGYGGKVAGDFSSVLSNTWVERTVVGSKIWTSITSSSDGTKLAAVVYGGYIYTSTDSGVTWIARSVAGQRNWMSITSSADGTKLAAVVGYGSTGYIYTSIDSGVTWTERTSAGVRQWVNIISSIDGTKLAGTEVGC
jgi:hypothetical protein